MAWDLYKTLQFFFFLLIFFFSPEAAITEQAEAGKPTGVDKDLAAARLITARQIKKRGCPGRQQRLTGCILFFPSPKTRFNEALSWL